MIDCNPEANLANRWTWLLLLGAACSDATAPPPGTFQAQLSGARVASLSGSAVAEVSFSEEFPDLQFVIRMHAVRGDTLGAIGIRCLGNQPPTTGAHTIDLAGADCVATYSRVLLVSQPGTVVLESADAVTGSVTIDASQAGETAGTFTFRGTMMVDSDSVGVLTASGSFSAELL